MPRFLRKFTFSDLELAFKVRGNMWNALIKFDINGNGLFEEHEIKQAMVDILNEDQNQVDYVVKNVFRYDLDGDKAVTYAQFTNFSVEQHFGEMAIQRLHRRDYYKNGAKRIMSLDQFENTLNYCLDFIYSRGTHADYQRLFSEVDLDRDGYISYQDYFIFLKEYFGSQSEAFENEQDNKGPPSPKKPEPPAPKFVDFSDDSPQQRFAKLIYSQFKVIVMERDRNRNLILEKGQLDDVLSNVLKLSAAEQSQITSQLSTASSQPRYEQHIRTVVVAYMSEISIKKYGLSQSISENQFIEFVAKVCHFVAVKPAQHVLQACFQQASRGANLSQTQYSNLMKSIFENFKFDNRGLASKGQRNATEFFSSTQTSTQSYVNQSYSTNAQNRYY